MDNNTPSKHQCPCCGYFTLDNKADNTFQICPVCYWEDDGVQLHYPDYSGGANTVSLNQAKRNYKIFGAVEERFKEDVRPPKDDEIKPLYY
jgi:hypothetical protein